MTNNAYCPLIDGGLSINLHKDQENFSINCCCLRDNSIQLSGIDDVWSHTELVKLRKHNKQDRWHPSCSACQIPESAGITSYRNGMLDAFGIKDNLTGPLKLDLNFDISCNLACRTCGPQLSTFWQKHLKENQIKINQPKVTTKVDELITILKTLDLSNLEMVTLSGGESLLGTAYWQVAEYIINTVPNADKQLTIQFQTNGTQTIDKKYYDLIERCRLVKLHFSIDGIKEKFEYLRWPANWNQVTDNMFQLRDQLPVNVMFQIEETLSIFNLLYTNELEIWAQENFSVNRLGANKQGTQGNVIHHGKHLATGTFSLLNLTIPYVDAVRKTKYANLISLNWQENPQQIRQMIREIEKFDNIRNQDWRKTFPEVAEFYSTYLS
jgi:sulfatase maturation enzyme AslB (radical SAM superfamily)